MVVWGDESWDGGERGRGAHIKIWPPGGYREVTCDYLLLDVRPRILDRVRVLLESSLRDPLGNHDISHLSVQNMGEVVATR